ncbi:MAG: SDR family oxidoreductase [Bdellovibrionota bacterium]
MKIVVTGALGHIGSAFIRKVSTFFPGSEVVIIDDMSTMRYCSLFNLPTGCKYTFIEGKVQKVDLSTIFKGATVVVHLAAITDAAGTSDKPELVHNNNFDSTKAVAEACMKLEVPMIFPSSTSVYGSQSELVDEECQELFPQSPYAESKINEEKLLLGMFKDGLKGVIFRFGTIFGKSEGMRFHTAVNKFSWQAVMKQPVTVWETAIDQKRPYLDIADAVELLGWTIQKQVYDRQLFNAATVNLTVRQIIDAVKVNVPDLEVVYVKHKIMNQLSYEVSSEKLRNRGFAFKGNHLDSIKESIRLFNGVNGVKL